jgi:hypothetical protein
MSDNYAIYYSMAYYSPPRATIFKPLMLFYAMLNPMTNSYKTSKNDFARGKVFQPNHERHPYKQYKSLLEGLKVNLIATNVNL